MYLENYSTIIPKNIPIKILGNQNVKMIAKVKSTVCIKSERPKKDGTCSIYIILRQSGKAKKIFLDLSVKSNLFDKEKGRVKGKSELAKDYNLLIENKLSEISKIEMDFRMSKQYFDLDVLHKELNNPAPRFDFIAFWEQEMEYQKKILKPGTYRQQYSSLSKLKSFKSKIHFTEINEQFIQSVELWCKNVLKNQATTISTLMKNIKKYIHIASKKGIITPIHYDDIKVKSFTGQRTFLEKHELQLLHKFYVSEFIPDHHKKVLSKFLFSCFTSLRISDIQKINRDNIVNNELIYVSEKTGKMNKIKLNLSAKKYINEKGDLFNDNFTNEYINRTLKDICVVLSIKKRITFHCARHTFATMFLLQGGNIINLQKILDHSNIRETMVYSHIVEQVLNEEINFMDAILE